jgi:tetratricopeptide (TPR) repeat protein
LALALALALVRPASAQVWKGTEDYNGYMAVYSEKDPVKKAAAGEKFLNDFKDADPIARTNAYQMIVLAYATAGNWAKTLEWIDRMPQLGAGLPQAEKDRFLQIALQAAGQINNAPKVKEYAQKVLAVDANNVSALVTMSGILANSLPADESARNSQIQSTIDITSRALKQPKPAGATDPQWNPVVVQLHQTNCLMLLNQKKYPESIAACEEALKVDKKSGLAYYLIGLAMKPSLADLVRKYTDANANYNANRTADQITVDDLKAVMDGAEKVASARKDEIVDIFGKAVASGGNAVAQATEELKRLDVAGDTLTTLVAAKKTELGIN